MKVEISFLKKNLHELGFEFVGFLPRSQTEKYLKAQEPFLQNWQNKGYAGEMNYMNRPCKLFTEPDNCLKNYSSIASFFIPYTANYLVDTQEIIDVPVGFGKVARYAWGQDYHHIIKEKLKQFVEKFISVFGKNFNYRIFNDAVPMLERTLASGANLGFIGKNTLLIKPGFGSFGFLAEIIWDIELVEDSPSDLLEENNQANFIQLSSQKDNSIKKNNSKKRCGECKNCLTACPTQAFSGAYQLDATKCISYLTIEKKGILSTQEAKAIGNWIFGCDICQEVCPFNHSKNQKLKVFKEFEPSAGVGALVNLQEVLHIADDKEYEQRYEATPLMRCGRSGLIRNAICVALNTKDDDSVKRIKYLSLYDHSEVVREQALQQLEFFQVN